VLNGFFLSQMRFRNKYMPVRRFGGYLYLRVQKKAQQAKRSRTPGSWCPRRSYIKINNVYKCKRMLLYKAHFQLHLRRPPCNKVSVYARSRNTAATPRELLLQSPVPFTCSCTLLTHGRLFYYKYVKWYS
jgi:hypothetical protein